MKKTRRAGATTTFSVSISEAAKAVLRARAIRLHGGNMSALIEELGREAEKRDAFEKLREWAGGSRLTEEARTAIDAELDEGWALASGHAKRTRKKRAA